MLASHCFEFICVVLDLTRRDHQSKDSISTFRREEAVLRKERFEKRQQIGRGMKAGYSAEPLICIDNTVCVDLIESARGQAVIGVIGVDAVDADSFERRRVLAKP